MSRKYLNDKEIADVITHLLANWSSYRDKGLTYTDVAKEVHEALGIELGAQRVSKMALHAGLPAYRKKSIKRGKRYGGSRNTRFIASVLASYFTNPDPKAAVTDQDLRNLLNIADGKPIELDE